MFYFSDICFSSKVYTRESDAVISEPFNLKFRYYKDNVISNALREELSKKLSALKQQVCAFNQTIQMYALKLLRE
jgi:stress-induced morphogen